jgi:cell shape-determining protein MreC
MKSPGLRAWLFLGVAALALAWCALQLWRRTAWRVAADFQHPFLAVGEAGRAGIAGSALLLKGKPELARTVDALRRENESLRARLAVDHDLARENTQLRQLLSLAPRLRYRAIHAEVRARDPLAWRERLTINRGAEAGIQEGAVVLCLLSEGDDEATGFAVVGRVVAVSRHSAQVATVLSPLCQFSVLLAESHFSGMAQGAGRGGGGAGGVIRHLPRDGQIRAGEMVLTSGYSGLTPAGLLLGWVAGRGAGSPETRVADQLHLEAGFLAAADIDQVKTLLVLTAAGREP